jgi:hypothetical protein
VNGGHLAMGRPMGVTGAVLLTSLVHELERCDGTTGQVVEQAGSGVGSAMIVERVRELVAGVEVSVGAEELIGAWSLRDWRIEYEDGRVTRPFGADAAGQLLYSADGRMSATVSARDRRALDTANARDAAGADKATAFDSYFHYAGRWHLDGDVVVHTVSLALNPGFVGTAQRRSVRLEGPELELAAQESMGDGQPRRHVIDWQRVAAD